ncbi:MAG: alpha/beta hydrolase [Acidobacteria bacterium]|nr:alpha/beta hydrolase [Acidobacteriota bacterium]MCB9399348.1 alpha/beta hydrolase [Acidobacteriota bacterium]
MLFALCLLLQASPNLVKINGTELLVKSIGSGEPIILLHGGPGLSHDYFLPAFETLAKTHQVIFFDQRLSGASSVDVEADQITMDAFVADINGIADHFKLEKFHLLGHSYGGLIAMFYAKAHPERLKSLMLVDSVMGDDHYAATFTQAFSARVKPEFTEAMQKIKDTELFRSRDPETMRSYFQIAFKAALHNPEDSDKLNLKFADDYGIKSAKLSGLVRNLGHYHLDGDMQKLEVPVWVVYGASDPMPEEGRKMLAAYFPKGIYDEIPDAGHFPFVEQPEVFFQKFQGFLKTLQTP